MVNHLQFVKVLYKPDELAQRMKRFEQVRETTGFACFYTVVVDKEEGERTFCNLPVQRGRGGGFGRRMGWQRMRLRRIVGCF